MFKKFLTGLNPLKGLQNEFISNIDSTESGEGNIDWSTFIGSGIKNAIMTISIVISLLAGYYYATGDLVKAGQLIEIKTDLDQLAE